MTSYMGLRILHPWPYSVLTIRKYFTNEDTWSEKVRVEIQTQISPMRGRATPLPPSLDMIFEEVLYAHWLDWSEVLFFFNIFGNLGPALKNGKILIQTSDVLCAFVVSK